MPFRHGWSNFKTRTAAKCVWFTIDAKKAYSQLLQRQNSDGEKTIDGKKVSDMWQFGSWNQDVVTYFHPSLRKWKPDLEETCIRNINQFIENWSKEYEKNSVLAFDFCSVRDHSNEAENIFESVYKLF